MAAAVVAAAVVVAVVVAAMIALAVVVTVVMALPNIRHIFLFYSRTLLDFIPAFGVYYYR